MALDLAPDGAGGSALAAMRSRATDKSEAIRLACVWEAAAPKVGNVHPDAAFEDCDYQDFCRAAAAVAPILAGVDERFPDRTGLGRRVREAIEATRLVTSANVNLGIVLLIAPLATAVDRGDVARVLMGLTAEDGAEIYRAISLAKPGGIRDQAVDPERDVTRPLAGPIDLLAAMRSAKDRDRIALQYAENFDDFFESVVPVVARELTAGSDIGQALLRAQLRLLAEEPDSLIRRKCGPQVAEEVWRRSKACWDGGGELKLAAVGMLDRWLRADGNRRNPGTTADLIAAAIYWCIRR